MGRFLIYVAYIGTNYSGFQKQVGIKNVKTIQGQMDVALKFLNPANEIKSHPSSRTDTGVHALENTLHVDLIHKRPDIEYNPEEVKTTLNYWMRKHEETIVVTNVLRVPDDFHSRKHAVSRSYLYRLAIPWKTIEHHKGYAAMSFFESKRAHIIFKPVNIEKLMACAELMVGTYDYTSFTTIKSLRESNKDPIKTVSIDVKLGTSFLRCHNPGLEIWEIHVTSQSFLYRQIRRMVGAMIQASLDYLTLDYVKQTLLDPDLKLTNTKILSSPPHGLYLKNVCYNPEGLIYDPDSQLKEEEQAPNYVTTTDAQNDT